MPTVLVVSDTLSSSTDCTVDVLPVCVSLFVIHLEVPVDVKGLEYLDHLHGDIQGDGHLRGRMAESGDEICSRPQKG